MNQEVYIRQETPNDYSFVIELTEKAFKPLEISNGNEGRLIDKLRKSPDFICELSMVAELNGQVVAHLLLTPIRIINGTKQFKSLVLAPVSVLPEFQKKGIGSQLIHTGHQKAIELGFHSVILLGHPQYYPRFGYKPASQWGIKTHYKLPSDDVFMAVELSEGALSGISGMVVFPPEFD